jgi:hypothetical protein
MRPIVSLALTGLPLCLLSNGFAVEVQQTELHRAEQWVAAKFQARTQPGEVGSFLAPARHDAGFELNGHLGRALRINKQDFVSGIFMGGAEEVRVHLADAAEALDVRG